MTEREKPEELIERISDAEFLIYLKDREVELNLRLREATTIIRNIMDALNGVYYTRDSFEEAKRNGLQVRCVMNEKGECWFRTDEKPPMGFITSEGGKI